MPTRSEPDGSGRILATQFGRFSVAGGVGFLVEAAVLTVLVSGLGGNVYLSRVGSFLVAVTATWWINRRYAFRSGASARREAEYGRYFVVQVVGVLINFAIFVLVLTLFPQTARYPVIPLAAGSGVAMVANFLGLRMFVFRG